MTSYLKSNNSAEGVPEENNWLFMALIEAFVLIENALNQWSDMLNGFLIRSAGASRVVNADNGRKDRFESRMIMPGCVDGGGASRPREADENHVDWQRRKV